MKDLGAAAVAAGLLARPAGYSVVDRCLEEQSASAPRSWIADQLGLSPLAHSARIWYASALGERAVAKILSGLGEEWTTIHSLPLGPDSADIDHLVIGPAGVFTINTKAVRGHVWVNGTRILISGRRVDYVPAAEREARRVHVELTRATGSSVFVRPLLIFVESGPLTVRERPASVTVLTSGILAEWLGRQERIYPEHRVRELVAAAAAESTWNVESIARDELGRRMRRFDRLSAEVAEASRRWRMARLAAVMWAGALALGAILLTTSALVARF